MPSYEITFITLPGKINRPKLVTCVYGTAWCKDYGRSGRGFSTRRKGNGRSTTWTVAWTTRYQREGRSRRDQQEDRIPQRHAGPGQDRCRRKEELHAHGRCPTDVGTHQKRG